MAKLNPELNPDLIALENETEQADDIAEEYVINPNTIKYDSRIKAYLKAHLPHAIAAPLTSAAAIAAGASLIFTGVGSVATIVAGAAALGGAGASIFTGIDTREVSQAPYKKMGIETVMYNITEAEKDAYELTQKLHEVQNSKEKKIVIDDEEYSARALKKRIKGYESKAYAGIKYLTKQGTILSEKIVEIATKEHNKVAITDKERRVKEEYINTLYRFNECITEVISRRTEHNPYKGLIIDAISNGCLLGKNTYENEVLYKASTYGKQKVKQHYFELFEEKLLTEATNYKSPEQRLREEKSALQAKLDEVQEIALAEHQGALAMEQKAEYFEGSYNDLKTEITQAFKTIFEEIAKQQGKKFSGQFEQSIDKIALYVIDYLVKLNNNANIAEMKRDHLQQGFAAFTVRLQDLVKADQSLFDRIQEAYKQDNGKELYAIVKEIIDGLSEKVNKAEQDKAEYKNHLEKYEEYFKEMVTAIAEKNSGLLGQRFMELTADQIAPIVIASIRSIADAKELSENTIKQLIEVVAKGVQDVEVQEKLANAQPNEIPGIVEGILDGYTSKIKTQQESINAYAGELNAQISAKNDAQERAKNITGLYKQEQRKNVESTRKIDQLEQDLKDAYAREEEGALMLHDAQNQAKMYEQSTNKLTKKVNLMSKKLDNVTEQRDTAEYFLGEANEYIASLGEENTSLRKRNGRDREIARNVVASAQQALNASRAQNQTDSAVITGLTNALESQISKGKNTRQRLVRTNSENQKLKGKIEQQSQKIFEQNEQIDSFVTAQNQNINRIIELEADNDIKDEKIEKLEKVRDEFKEQAIQTQQQNEEKLHNERVSLVEEFLSTTDELKKKIVLVQNEAKSTRESLEADKSKLQAELDTINDTDYKRNLGLARHRLAVKIEDVWNHIKIAEEEDLAKYGKSTSKVLEKLAGATMIIKTYNDIAVLKEAKDALDAIYKTEKTNAKWPKYIKDKKQTTIIPGTPIPPSPEDDLFYNL